MSPLVPTCFCLLVVCYSVSESGGGAEERPCRAVDARERALRRMGLGWCRVGEDVRGWSEGESAVDVELHPRGTGTMRRTARKLRRSTRFDLRWCVMVYIVLSNREPSCRPLDAKSKRSRTQHEPRERRHHQGQGRRARADAVTRIGSGGRGGPTEAERARAGDHLPVDSDERADQVVWCCKRVLICVLMHACV